MKWSLLVEAGRGPLAVVVAGANVLDAKLLAATIEVVVLERPPVQESWPQHLYLEKGYDNEDGWGACVDHDYEPHIALIRDERPTHPKPYKPRRCVVERTLAWLSKCRATLIRWDKKEDKYQGLLKLACTLLWFRRYDRLAGLRTMPEP